MSSQIVSSQTMPTEIEIRSNRVEDAEDARLRTDIRLLGRILGDTVRDQEGADVFDLVERIRQTSIRFHRDEDKQARRELEAILDSMSTGQTVRDAQPIYGRMFQTPFSEQVRNEARVATMCVGNITTADQVNTILAAGRADLVALGRPHLVDPSFTMRAAAWYGAEIACPPQYLLGKEQIFRNSVRDRQDFDDLKIKGKPKTRAELKAEATKPLAAE